MSTTAAEVDSFDAIDHDAQIDLLESDALTDDEKQQAADECARLTADFQRSIMAQVAGDGVLFLQECAMCCGMRVLVDGNVCQRCDDARFADELAKQIREQALEEQLRRDELMQCLELEAGELARTD
jgi:hypothetical protein